MALDRLLQLPPSTQGVLALIDEFFRELISLPHEDRAARFQSLAQLSDALILRRPDLVLDHPDYPPDWLPLIGTVGAHVDATLAVLVSRNPAEPDFYERLWLYLNSGFPFSSDTERHFALWWILVDSRIPYFQLDPARAVPIDSDSLIRKWVQLGEPFHRLRFLIHSDITDVCRIGAYLADIFDRMPAAENRAILFAALIAELQDRLLANQDSELSD